MNIPRVVYMLRNTVTNRCYVGSTSNLEHRLKGHFGDLKRGKHSVEDMQADYDEYGDHFQVIILDKIIRFDDRGKEYEWMRKLSTNNRRLGYNYKDQSFQNTKRLTRYLFEYKGELRNVSELSRICGIKPEVLRNRLVIQKWDVERAMNTKYDARKHNKKGDGHGENENNVRACSGRME